MSARAPSFDVVSDPRSHTRSTSTTSSNRSSSSADSFDHAPPPIQSSKGRKKSGSFSKFFSVKEPSAAAFEKLAEQRQKELAQKGQRLPFGVPSKKLPDSVKDDYKNAKQRAKERAKVHEAVKEKLKTHEEHELHRHQAKASISGPIPPNDAVTIHDYYRPSNLSSPSPPKSPISSVKRLTPRLRKGSSLDPLPELPSIEAVSSRPGYQNLPPSPRIPSHSRSASREITGVLTANARKDALPWE